MSGLMSDLRSGFRRLRYAAANWRFFRESARLKLAPALPEDRRREIIDGFHLLWYETAYDASAGWTHPNWLGTRTLKCPFDLWIYQEILVELRPDLVVETGTASGGSALFLATIQEILGVGSTVSIDIAAKADRPRHPRLEYLLGSSTSPTILSEVRDRASRASRVMVILDSDHRKSHVAQELLLYSPLVTPGSYLVVEDTNVNGRPVFQGFGPGPGEAVDEFVAAHPEFTRDRSRERFLVTFNPGGYLRRRVDGPGKADPASGNGKNP